MAKNLIPSLGGVTDGNHKAALRWYGQRTHRYTCEDR